MSRETWLIEAAKRLDVTLWQKHDLDFPEFHVSTGLPSKRALSSGNRRIGECWAAEASNDEKPHIFISPILDDTIEVLGVLHHEIIHAMGIKGHRKDFKAIMLMTGLEGRATATVPSDRVIEEVYEPIIELLGKYPHAALDPSNRKKQTTRLVKCECEECGYIVRTTWKWIDEAGAPICPTDHVTMEVKV